MARTSDKDVLDKFRFKVTFTAGTPALTVAGFQSCQMPKRTTSKITYREGIDTDIQFNSAGISTMEDIVLAKGLTTRAGRDFYTWIKQVHKPTSAGEPGVPYVVADADRNNYRKELQIDMLNRTGTVVKTWKIYNAFPVQFTPGSDLDASADDSKSISSLTLTYDDFEEVL